MGEIQPGETGWQARLEIGFEARAGRTILSRRCHTGPLIVQKPFYPERETCHVYLLHPPGGVVGGDQLTIVIDVARDAQALITTPASTKFYRSKGALSVQGQSLRVAGGATLEWLPQETILFAGCQAALTTQISLAPDARFIGWEVLCLGRPAAEERFDEGVCQQRFEVWREDLPLWIERAKLEGGSSLLSAAWGLRGYTVLGTLVAIPANEAIVAAVREGITVRDGELFSATLIDQALVCRYLGSQGEAARRCLVSAWSAIRPKLLGRRPCPPRIWRS
jgi:urease accessory protein